MVKSQALIFVAGALVVLLSMAAVSEGQDDRFFVEGQVYCDPCRFQFVSRLIEYLEGAKVRLECRNITRGDITYQTEGVTNNRGLYSLPVDGDYQDDICEVQLVSSPKSDCSDIPIDASTNTKLAATVSLTSNNGVTSPVRTVNPLGFMRKDALPECPEVMKELGIGGEDEDQD